MVDIQPNNPSNSLSKSPNRTPSNEHHQECEPVVCQPDQTQSGRANLGRVVPSSRDSISSWLDILTSMLSLPESQQTQIRDELEDHLRSRVDDLLITGTPEPKAIQIAVAELGETAELAKVISHAHTQLKPRRRIMNAALILAAVAGLSIGGISMNNSARTTGAAGAALAPSAIVLADEPESSHQEEASKTFSFQDEKAAVILMKVAEAFGADIEFLNHSSQVDLSIMYTSFEGDYTLEKAIEVLNIAHLSSMNNHRAVLDGNTIRVMSADEYSRSRIELRIYPSPSWIIGGADRYDYAKSLENLLEIKHNLQYTTIEVVDEAIIVAAPPEIHSELKKIASDLNVIIERRHEQRRIENQARDVERELQQAESIERQRLHDLKESERFQLAVTRLQEEFDQSRTSLLVAKDKLRNIENEQANLMNIFNPGVRDRDQKSDADQPQKTLTQEQRQARLIDLERIRDELLLDIDENQERYTHLRNRLLDSEFAQLFNGLQ